MGEIAIEDMVPLITCARCVAPGTYCKALPLSKHFPLGSTHNSIAVEMAEIGEPFIPIRRLHVLNGCENADGTGSHWYELWLFTCPKLTKEGRCSIYDERPYACRVYEPGVDAMCVHMLMPNGQPILPLLP